MVRDGLRYKYLDQKVPSDKPRRRPALQKVYDQKRAPMKRFELICFSFYFTCNGWFFPAFLLCLRTSIWLSPHIVQGVLCPAEEGSVSEMRGIYAEQQLLEF